MRIVRHCLLAALFASPAAHALPRIPKPPVDLPKPKPKPAPEPAAEEEPAEEEPAEAPAPSSTPVRGDRSRASSGPPPDADAPIPAVPADFQLVPVDGARTATLRAPT